MTTRDRSLTLFGQTMAYVAATAGFFALGAYTAALLGINTTLPAVLCIVAGIGVAVVASVALAIERHIVPLKGGPEDAEYGK